MGSSTGGDIANSQKAWKSPTNAEALSRVNTHFLEGVMACSRTSLDSSIPWRVRVKNCNALWISYESVNRMMIDQCIIMHYQCVIHQKNQDAP